MSEEIKVEWIIVQMNGRFVTSYEFEAPSVGIHDDTKSVTFHMINSEADAKRFYFEEEEHRAVLGILKENKNDASVTFFYAFRDERLNEIRYYHERV